MTHSPAPWTKAGRYGKYSDEITDANGQAIAWVFTRKADPQTVTGILPNPQGEANAHLLAAAPELLLALRAVVEAIEYRVDMLNMYSALRNTIAKAEGR